MAKVIEFYIPDSFRSKPKWVSADQPGKIIEFPRRVKKSARLHSPNSAPFVGCESKG